MRRVLGSLGALVGLGSLLFLVIFVAEIFGFGDGKTEMPVLIGLALFFGGTTACGAWLARWGFTDAPAPDAAPDPPPMRANRAAIQRRGYATARHRKCPWVRNRRPSPAMT